MICPYNRGEEKDKVAETKHKCIIKNNVKILKEENKKNIENILQKI